MEKSLVISVRLSPAEVEYLASSSEFEGATLSEKVRTLISRSKRSERAVENYALLRELTDEQCRPTIREVQQLEFEYNLRSELISMVIGWLPEFLAYFLSFRALRITAGTENNHTDSDNLLRFEEGVSERILSLVYGVLRLGAAHHAPMYSKRKVRDLHLIELCEQILRSEENKNE